jgi:hypothetical protein
MKNNFIKIALGMILAIGSAKAADTRTFVNGYYFQHVSKITGNLTSTSANNGNMAGKITVINQDQRWTADTVYILDNLTFVEPPATLTIEPGTIVRGAPLLYRGTSTLDPSVIGDLNICRGANIVAKGTAAAPIIMTSFYDPLVPGGLATVPHDIVNINGTLSAISDATIALEAGLYSDLNATSGSFKAHSIDAKWGSLTLLGRGVVGFGGPTGSAGNLLVSISNSNKNLQTYTENPTFTFGTYIKNGTTYNYSSGSSDANSPTGSGFNLEALFNPVPVASVYIDGTSSTSKGKFTGEKPILKATAAAGSRTGDKTVLGAVTVTLNDSGDGTDPATTSTFAAGNDFWEVTAVAITTPGIQYNVPTQKDSAPFLADYGYSGAQIAFQFDGADSRNVTKTTTDGVSAAIGSVKGSLSINGVKATGVTTLPVAKMKLSQTYLYGVIVKAPSAYGPLTGTAPSLTITLGNSTANPAVASCSISSTPVSDPEAIPLKSGIGANFIEGKQAIGGANYGVASNPTVDASGNAWTTLSGGIYGGNNNDDNSGTVNFVQLRHGGYILSPNNEINGLTFGGVGRGTSIEYVEVFCNADDDFEMFGGAVNLKHVAGMFSGDDIFDTDMGYRGQGQFMFGCQNNTVGSVPSKGTGRDFNNIGDNLGENDGNEDPNYIANTTYPGTDFCYFNTTMIGIGYIMPANTTFPSDRQGPNFKDNSGGKVFNSIYVEAPSGAMCDQATVATTDDALRVGARRIVDNTLGNTVRNANGDLIQEPQGVLAFDTWVKCGGGKASTGPVVANYTDIAVNGALFPQASGRTSSGGSKANQSVAVAKTLEGPLMNRFLGDNVLNSTGTNGRLAGVDPTLPAGSAERSNGTNPRASAVVAPGVATGLQSNLADRGTFYAPTSFRGAFKDFNWMKGWTHSDELGVLAGNGVVAPDVTLTRDGSGNVVVNFNGASGIQYIIETSSDNKTFVPLNDATILGSNQAIAKNLGVGGLLFVRVNPL